MQLEMQFLLYFNKLFVPFKAFFCNITLYSSLALIKLLENPNSNQNADVTLNRQSAST